MERGKILNAADLPNTPGWAKPLVAAALKLSLGRAGAQRDRDSAGFRR